MPNAAVGEYEGKYGSCRCLCEEHYRQRRHCVVDSSSRRSHDPTVMRLFSTRKPSIASLPRLNLEIDPKWMRALAPPTWQIQVQIPDRSPKTGKITASRIAIFNALGIPLKRGTGVEKATTRHPPEAESCFVEPRVILGRFDDWETYAGRRIRI